MDDELETMYCPECSALHGYNIAMRYLCYVKQYTTTTEMVTGSKIYLKLYQCPCCKAVYTEEIDEETEVWKERYKQLMKEYRLSQAEEEVEEDDNTGIAEN